MNKKRNATHLNYFITIITLMLFTLVLTSTLIFAIGKLDAKINFALVIVYALFSGFVSAKIIDKITHKEKREILASSLIPLPTTISIIIYLSILNNLKFVDTIDPLWASAAFFVSFNIPSLVMIYEHEKHKHHLIGFAIAPLIMVVVYLFTYFLTAVIGIDIVQPQVINSFTLVYEIAPIQSYVENCMKSVGEDAIDKKVDLKTYLDSNLNSCINSFAAFENFDIRADNFSSSVVYGEDLITIKLDYPISFTENNFNYRISDFQTTIRR